MNWSLINEIGLHGESDAPPDHRKLLRFPAFAARDASGNYLIVDELGKEKLVPFRFESRTILVDSDGNCLYDSVARGIFDGFGCPCDDGRIAILKRTTWELLIVSPDDLSTERLPLATMSKRLPRHVSPTASGTFLISFLNRPGQVDLIEVDPHGRLLWVLDRLPDGIGIAGSIQLTPRDTILIADPMCHVVVEIDRTGRVIWQFGETDHPAADTRHLSSPHSARILPDDRILIADTRNHRIVLASRDGAGESLPLAAGEFCDPTFADIMEDGNYLICDSGNARVVELDSLGKQVWQFGNEFGSEHLFSYPRSVDLTASGAILVADTAHDRIVEVTQSETVPRSVDVEPGLFWPRCARALPTGGMIVADGRNGRVVEFGATGEAVHVLREVDLGGGRLLGDPHDVHLLPVGNLLIVDSMHHLVVETDWTGKVGRVFGGGTELRLKDPHSAQPLSGGGVVIADTGNDRILVLGPDGELRDERKIIQTDDGCYRLNAPRYVEVIADGTMLIADTGNNRMLALSDEGRFLWEFSAVPNSRLAFLNQPRWAKLIHRYEMIVCDHFHHRILHVRYGIPESGRSRTRDESAISN